MDNRPARYCAEFQKTVGYSNWAHHQRRHRDYGVASRHNNVETRQPGGRGRPKDQHSGCPTCRLLISEEDVAPASRACARRAAELFVWVLLQPLFVVDYRMRSATCPTESVKRESMRLGRYSVSSGVELDRGLLIHITVCRHHLVDK